MFCAITKSTIHVEEYKFYYENIIYYKFSHKSSRKWVIIEKSQGEYSES